MDPSKIRQKIGRFRILIIGRANAGKTTILQRVCNTGEEPAIYNRTGEQINPAVLNASRECGKHDIENELVFKSNPGFVFHDSRGFEAGSESEFDKVKEFITRRSKETSLPDRLHAIWYCIPMDQECRSFTAGERKFFSQCDTGTIPVIVLFTKFDALHDDAYMELTSREMPGEIASAQAPKHAEQSFANGPQLKFLKDLQPPKCHVCLPDMNKDGADCGPLIQCTAGTLDNDVLQRLFISTQQTNLELCMEYALRRILPNSIDHAVATEDWHELIIARSGVWFPHISVEEFGEFDFLERLRMDFFFFEDREFLLLELFFFFEELLRSHCTDMRSRLLSVISGSSLLENDVQLMSAVVIIFEHSFHINHKQRYLPGKTKSITSFLVALEQYMASPHAAAVKTGVNAAVQAYEEAVTVPAPTYEEAVTTATRAYEEAVATAAHAYEEAAKGKRSTWMAKLQFEPLKRKAQNAFRRSKGKKKEASKEAQVFEYSEEEKEVLCSQVKAGLIKTILEITLNHRLPRP